MPLYGGGNLNKKKGTRRGKGNEQKSGMKGIAAQYITRNKAIKKLQISLKDFRCATEQTGTRGRSGGERRSGGLRNNRRTAPLRGLADRCDDHARTRTGTTNARSNETHTLRIRAHSDGAVRLHCDAAER